MSEYNQIKEKIAPCGLNCGKCFAFYNGDIKKHSIGLKESLGNFEIYAKRFSELLNEPLFNRYPDFYSLLSYFVSVKCMGCRNESCKLFSSCKVKECAITKGVDFCFQCNEFPCSETGFDEHLYNRYVEINKKMKEKGIVDYYETIKDLPRYK